MSEHQTEPRRGGCPRRSPEEKAASRRAWREANKERIAAKQRAWEEANKDRRVATQRAWCAANKERVAANNRVWCEANPEYKAAFNRTWREANLKYKKAADRAWYEANQTRAIVTHHAYRARKHSAPGYFTEHDIERLRIEQSGKCAAPHCGTWLSASETVDHIVPVSRGGSNWPGNIQLLCKCCNRSKGMETMEEWLRGDAEVA